jgi:superfamily II DNA or RNA helicase
MTGRFQDFYSSLDADSGKRGRQFERFVKWFLQADPEWSTQVEKVWLWDEYPDRWGADCGVDLMFRHRNGDIWAVQAKCYAPEYQITKHDVDKFISESNRTGVDKRLLIATTDLIGTNARQVCDAQEKPVIRFVLSDFERAELEYPASIDALSQGKRRPPPQPREHQKEAVEAIARGFQGADRGQLIMACGTGKTLVALWVKERIAAQRTVVLVPSLGLISQILHEWTFASRAPFQVLCVCSDQTVGMRGEDEAIHSVADLAFPVTSAVDEVTRFLAGDGDRVIFSTYQSSPVIAGAQVESDIPPFDLVVADEAHRCAGNASSDFATVLDANQIRSRKRLFATATPRTYSKHISKLAEERGVEVVGMDDAETFGGVMYALPFGEAIKRNLLTDYRVVIIGVDDPMIAAWIADRELVTTRTDIETDSETLAAQIGILKAIKDYDLKRMITFHGRVNRAEAFANDIHGVMEWIMAEHRPDGDLHTDFVSGSMSSFQRKVKLGRLKQLGSGERGILSNARCLSEGVDVPSLDGVAFVDPRSSQVDIIQAVGRAIRLSPDKKVGTIVLPVFIEAGKNPDETIAISKFQPIWDVLNALKAHDNVLANELDQARTSLGRRPEAGVTRDSLTKVVVDLPVTVGAEFGGALRTYLVEQVTASWNFWFGLLEAYAAKEGDCLVPAAYKTSDGLQLGSWVSTQRINKENLSLDRFVRLQSLKGWSWDPLTAAWEEAYTHLKTYCQEEGNCLVPANYKTKDGFQLGSWVSNQRIRADSVTPDRRDQLESLKGWSWDPFTAAWEEAYAHLKAYCNSNGNCFVSQSYKTADGFRLGGWVTKQREKMDAMTDERRQRLEGLEGWTWDPRNDLWEEGYGHLVHYCKEKGNCAVPDKYTTKEAFQLGSWVRTQRVKQDTITDERRHRLEGLKGWSWDPNADAWEIAYAHLENYCNAEGDCLVPRSYKTKDGFKLGSWLSTQRARQDTMTVGRRHRLENLKGWSWDAVVDGWEQGYSHLENYCKAEGDCLVPRSHVTNGGFKLGHWVNNLRADKENLSSDRRRRLESLKGWTWDPHAYAWDQGYARLKTYSEAEGNCLVSAKHITKDGFKLGNWVSNQRAKKDVLTAERLHRLESLRGWAWKVR